MKVSISKDTPTIGIPVYNDHGYLPLLLKTIRMYTRSEYHLVVVDDASSDPECAAATKAACAVYKADLIVHECNGGIRVWNTICQQGLSWGSDVIVICSNDVLVPPHWLDAAIVAFRENSKHPIGNVFWQALDLPQEDTLAQAKLMHTNLADLEYRFLHHASNCSANRFYPRGDIDKGDPTKNLMPLGVAFALKSETYQKVGSFPEDYVCFGESDFGLRCTNAGLCSLGLPYPLIYHAKSATFRDPRVREELKLSERCDISGNLFRERWVPVEHRLDPGLSFWPALEEVYRPKLLPLGTTRLLARRSPTATDKLLTTDGVVDTEHIVPGVSVREFILP